MFWGISQEDDSAISRIKMKYFIYGAITASLVTFGASQLSKKVKSNSLEQKTQIETTIDSTKVNESNYHNKDNNYDTLENYEATFF